jgi:hypothetical protein
MAKLLITNGLFVKLQRDNADRPGCGSRPELPMFSLLSGALLPINAPVTQTSPSIFDQFQTAFAPSAAFGPS